MVEIIESSGGLPSGESIVAFLRQGTEFLFVRDGDTGSDWRAIDGAVQGDETPVDAALRAVQQSTGLPESKVVLSTSASPVEDKEAEAALDGRVLHAFLFDVVDPDAMRLDPAWEPAWMGLHELESAGGSVELTRALRLCMEAERGRALR